MVDLGRARSFGAAAQEYDLHRPRYPKSLMESLVAWSGQWVLDVGAGTGIASEQLRAEGALVLAVEPDARMAALARGKGFEVEEAMFEDWDPQGRLFELVVFAQSFHWVEPRAGLEKVASVLKPEGRLALLWNRIVPLAPTQSDMERVYADYLPSGEQPSVQDKASVIEMIERAGFAVQAQDFREQLRYDARAWLDMVFTYSNHVTLEPEARGELRSRLAELIGEAGVEAENRGVALICAPQGKRAARPLP